MKYVKYIGPANRRAFGKYMTKEAEDLVASGEWEYITQREYLELKGLSSRDRRDRRDRSSRV